MDPEPQGRGEQEVDRVTESPAQAVAGHGAQGAVQVQVPRVRRGTDRSVRAQEDSGRKHQRIPSLVETGEEPHRLKKICRHCPCPSVIASCMRHWVRASLWGPKVRDAPPLPRLLSTVRRSGCSYVWLLSQSCRLWDFCREESCKDSHETLSLRGLEVAYR